MGVPVLKMTASEAVTIRGHDYIMREVPIPCPDPMSWHNYMRHYADIDPCAGMLMLICATELFYNTSLGSWAKGDKARP